MLRLLRREDIECALEVVGGGCEVYLGSGFGEASPSHPVQTLAALPRAEGLFDPGAYTMDRRVPGIDPGECFLLVAAPHRGRADAWRAALGPNRMAEVQAPIGTVGKHIAPGSSGKASGPARPSLTLAGVTETFSINAVLASAPTCALKPCTAARPLCLTQRPLSSTSLADAMIVAPTSVPIFTLTALAFNSAVTVSNSR